jgi:hypothetical protein
MTDQSFYLHWVSEKGRPPMPDETDEFQAAIKWYQLGLEEGLKRRLQSSVKVNRTKIHVPPL